MEPPNEKPIMWALVQPGFIYAYVLGRWSFSPPNEIDDVGWEIVRASCSERVKNFDRIDRY